MTPANLTRTSCSTTGSTLTPTRRRTYAHASKKRKADDLLTTTPASLSGQQTMTDPLTLSSKRTVVRPRSSYVPPSVYSHLPLLPDALATGLLVLFIGLNPGIHTARTGHAYSHPSNLFWKLLHRSGVTPRACRPEEDADMPQLYSLGLTNIVSRPSRNGAELSRAEMDAGVAALEAKARRWRPEVVCVVGKSIWESVWRMRHGGRGLTKGQFTYGWQAETEKMGATSDEQGQEAEELENDVGYRNEVGGLTWTGARVFVAPSTSGLAATMRLEEKERIWKHLGTWVRQRRSEREAWDNTKRQKRRDIATP